MTACIVRRRRLGRTSCRGIAEKSRTGIRHVLHDQGIPEADLYIRWGCTANVPGRNVLNTAEAIHQVNAKAAFRMLLNEHELCPATFLRAEDIPEDLLQNQGVIVRPRNHSRGKDMALLFDRERVAATLAQWGGGYAGKFIKKAHEYRVAVVQGRVAWVAQKTPGNPDDIAWNVARGGRFDNVRWDNWPLKAVRYAVEAFNLSDLDFGGVDVMVDAEGQPYVIEINSAPSLTSDYRQQCMAKCFDWIVENGKQRIPMIEERGGYRKFIHPAVCERATLVN